MDGRIRIFVLQETRFRQGAIENAIGTVGRWPFRRDISYQTGVNCDTIAVEDEKLHVVRRGRTIAVAELIGNPTRFARMLRAIRRTLLPSARADRLEWEDLLRRRHSK